MTIATFIRDKVLLPRLEQTHCLVVYDVDRRYRNVVESLATEGITFIDATESSILSRDLAIQTLRRFERSGHDFGGLVIYVPAKPPLTDEEKQRDPFAIYIACGSVFPNSDGDDYLNLCLRARPDHGTEIRRLFANSENGPSFTLIDSLGNGNEWPQLRSTLRVDSANEILSCLLSPSSTQLQSLKTEDNWVDEAKDFLSRSLGLTLKTKSKSVAPISDEIWRYVLFSEFVFDLPEPLPNALHNVPKAPTFAQPIIFDVCDRLRKDTRHSGHYIDRASGIELELNLPNLCESIVDLGERDTFPFEERTFLRNATSYILNGQIDEARSMLVRQTSSVWISKGSSQLQWDVIRAALALLDECTLLLTSLSSRCRNLDDLIAFYISGITKADRFHRELETTINQLLDLDGEFDQVTTLARNQYTKLVDSAHNHFLRLLSNSSWPPKDFLSSTNIFDNHVAHRLQESGRRVAYLMVDALRYELGLELHKLLSEDSPAEISTVCAPFPTITKVGMASLLPGASNGLHLSVSDNEIVPSLSANSVTNVTQRMQVFAAKYGDRFTEMQLSEFLKSKASVKETVDLIVLRSNEIDSHLELNPSALLGFVKQSFQQIRGAVSKLKRLGFNEVIIVTDHGFVLSSAPSHGNVCQRPQGQWIYNAHERMLLGNGIADDFNILFASTTLGADTSVPLMATPKSLSAYRAGLNYFHGGVSLQEAIVPMIVVKLDSSQNVLTSCQVQISYKGGAKRITTRIPVLDVTLTVDDIFSQEISVELLIEAHDANGKVVGEPRGAETVNQLTSTITLTSGQRRQIPIRMDEDFTGKFTIKAMNPTTLALISKGSEISLETDYME